MAKVIDITEKLDLSGNPALMIAGKKIEVRADAATGLKIIGLFSEEGGSETQKTMKLLELLFSEDDYNLLLNGLGLSLKDLQIVIREAQALIMDNGEADEGEDQTHITT